MQRRGIGARKLGIGGAILAVIALSGGAVALAGAGGAQHKGASGGGCDDHLGCMWDHDNFEGSKDTVGNNNVENWTHWAFAFDDIDSARNRFTNRNFKLRRSADSDVLRCLDPGGNRPDFNVVGLREYRVGPIGSGC